MSRRSAKLGFVVPMSKPRYSCVESQATTSPPSRSASHTPSADLPEAVGPTTATRGSRDLSGLIGTGGEASERTGIGAQTKPVEKGRELVGERVSLGYVFWLKIIVIRKPQLDEISLERGWQGLKRSGSAD